jgi:phosphatidate cytidylyltransferase
MQAALKDLGYRLITAFVLLIVVVPVVFYGGKLRTILFLIAYSYAVFEYLSRSVLLPKYYLFVVTAFYLILPFSVINLGIESFFGVYLSILLLVAAFLVYTIEQLPHQPDLGKLYFSVMSSFFYPVLPLLSLFVINDRYSGEHILWVVAAVIAADTTAYFVGKLAGGKALSPRISPNKSLSGSLAGIIAASLASLAWGISFEFNEPVLRLIALGLLIGLLAVLGDLFESLMKRSLGLKDMGTLLPGHGGLLDRMDALIFALPVLFLI